MRVFYGSCRLGGLNALRSECDTFCNPAVNHHQLNLSHRFCLRELIGLAFEIQLLHEQPRALILNTPQCGENSRRTLFLSECTETLDFLAIAVQATADGRFASRQRDQIHAAEIELAFANLA